MSAGRTSTAQLVTPLTLSDRSSSSSDFYAVEISPTIQSPSSLSSTPATAPSSVSSPSATVITAPATTSTPEFEEKENSYPSAPRKSCCTRLGEWFYTRVLFFYPGISKTQRFMQTATSLFLGFEARQLAKALITPIFSYMAPEAENTDEFKWCVEALSDFLGVLACYRAQKGISKNLMKFNLFDDRFNAQEEVNARQNRAIRSLPEKLSPVLIKVVDELPIDESKKEALKKDVKKNLQEVADTLLEESSNSDAKKKKKSDGCCTSCFEAVCCCTQISSCCGFGTRSE